jgi:hypothetical protein
MLFSIGVVLAIVRMFTPVLAKDTKQVSLVDTGIDCEITVGRVLVLSWDRVQQEQLVRSHFYLALLDVPNCRPEHMYFQVPNRMSPGD